MSRSIDNRIVEMRFDNEQFEKGIQQSRESIKKLDSDLQFEGAKQGLTNLSQSIDNVSLSNIEQGIKSLQDRFSTFGIVGMRIIEQLTDSFIGLATRGISSVYNKIVTGGKRRAMNIENARFSLQGLVKDEKKVQEVMDVAMDSVDGTAYGFDEAAKAASMFVTTGLGAKDLKGPLKALAGVAAQTNSDYSRMAEIFTKVAGNNRLMGQELTQFSSYGLNASATLADYFNNHKKLLAQFRLGNKATEGEIRDLVSKGKIDFKTFAAAMEEAFGDHAKDANKTFTGAMQNIGAALSRIGAKFIQPLITQEGPFVRMFNSIRVIVNEVNKTIDPFANAFVKLMSSVADKISGIALITNGQEKPLLKIRVLMYSITNIFETMRDMVGIFKKAFTDAFHLPTLEEINKSFFNLWVNTVNIRHYLQTNENVTKVINGLVSALRILVSVFQAIFSIVGHVVKRMAPLGDQLLSIFGFIGGVTTQTEKWIDSNKVLEKIVSHINKVLDPLIDFLISIGNILKENFSKDGTFGSKFIKSFFDILNSGISSLIISFGNLLGLDFTKFSDKISSGLIKVRDVMSDVQNKLKEKWESKELEWLRKIIDNLKESLISIKNVFKQTFDEVGKRFETMNISPIGKAFKTLFSIMLAVGKVLGVVLHSLWEIIGPLVTDLFDALSEGDIHKFSDIFNSLLSVLVGLKAYQGYSATIGAFISFLKDLPNLLKNITSFGNTVKQLGFMFSQAKEYLKIKQIESVAKSILLIAAAAYLLSKIPAEDMSRAIFAIEVMIATLVGVLKLINSPGFINKQQNMAGATIMALGVSLLLMASALKKISKIDPERLNKSLIALITLMAALVGSLKVMSTISGGLKKVSSVLIAISVSILILAIALKKVAKIDPERLKDSVLAMISLIAALTASVSIMKAVGGNLKKVSSVLLAIGISMLLLTASLKSLSKVDSESLWTSFSVLSLMLLEVAAVIAALGIINKNVGNIKKVASTMIIASVAIAILSSSLVKLTKEMNPDNAAAALIVLGVALVELAIALTFMEGTKGGAAALIGASVGLLILVGALKMLASAGPEDLLFAVLALAAAMAIIIVTVAALSKIKGGMTTLRRLGNGLLKIGLAFLLIGAGVALVGVGLLTINAALLAFAATTEIVITTGMANITIFLQQLRLQIPIIAGIIVDLIVAIIKGLGAQIKIIIEVFKDIIIQVLRSLTELLPEVFAFLHEFVNQLLPFLDEEMPKILEAFTNLFLDLLDIIERKGPELTDKGVTTMISLINGLADALEKNKYKLVLAFSKLAGTCLDTFIIALGLEPQDEGHKADVSSGRNIMEVIMLFIGKLMVGLGEKGADLIAAIGEFGADCVEAVVNAFGAAYDAGKKFIANIWDGLKSGWEKLILGISKMGSGALTAFSASMGLGGDLSGVLSGINGIKFDADINAALQKVRLSSDTQKDFQNKITEMISTKYSGAVLQSKDYNFSPVITPVVDSTNVDEFYNSLNSSVLLPSKINYDWMKNWDSISSGNYGYRKNAIDNLTATQRAVNFVQNNYSPEPLSQIDIYRNTQNLLVSTGSGFIYSGS